MPRGHPPSPATRALLAAGLLVAGEALGFACPAAAPGWPLAVLLLVLLALVSYGWRLPTLAWAAPLLLGAALALHATAQPGRMPAPRARTAFRQTRRQPAVRAAPAEPSRWDRLSAALARGLGVGLGWNRELADLDRAILLGRRDGISPARRRLFAEAGTIHVFAISGLHVMVVAWMLNGALLRLEAPLRLRGLLCLPPLWAYVVLTGAHPSAVRAALMASFHLFATVLDRRPDARISWSLTAIVVYALHPERLLDVGCTFSFTVMLGIVLWLDCARQLDRLIPAERTGLRRFVGEFGVTFVAWAAGVPIAAHVFGRFTPGGLLANYFVLHCARPLVQCGFGALVAGLFCPLLAALLNNAAAGCAWAMVFISEQVAALPFSTFEVRPWSPAACAVWYGVCLGALLSATRGLAHLGRTSGRWW